MDRTPRGQPEQADRRKEERSALVCLGPSELSAHRGCRRRLCGENRWDPFSRQRHFGLFVSWTGVTQPLRYLSGSQNGFYLRYVLIPSLARNGKYQSDEGSFDRRKAIRQ